MRTLTISLCLVIGSVGAMGQSLSNQEKIARENEFKNKNTGYVSQEKATFASLSDDDQNKVIMEVRHAHFLDYDFSKMDPKVYKKFQEEVKTEFCSVKVSTSTTKTSTAHTNHSNVKDVTRKGTPDEQYKEIMLKLIEKYKVEKKA